MPIKPIDMQLVISKSQQLAKIKQTEDDNQKNFFHNQAISENKKITKETKQVNKPNESYKGKINEDNQKDNQKGSNENSRRNYKKKNDDNTKEISENFYLGNKIDIKI